MKVAALIQLLQQCDPEALAIINFAPSRGWEEITAVHRRDEHGGVGFRLSTETIKTVELGSGSVPYMRKQGMDVLGEEEA